MHTHPRPPGIVRQRKGVALILTLAFIVLVTVTILAFFSRATSNRITEASRAKKIEAEQMAENASDYIIGTFLTEIATKSSPLTSGGYTVFRPTTPGDVPPARAVSASIPATPEFATLLRQSAPGADPGASSHSTATAARNGRLVGTGRWNSPRFFATGFTAINQLPNWVYVKRDGSTTNTPDREVIGRFAYNVYATGGLLDANVAGHRDDLSADDLAAVKSTLAGADLTALGIGQDVINKLVEFRNPGSLASAAYRTMAIASAKEGFLQRVGTGFTNNLFLSRQDLLRYAALENPGLTPALPFLTARTREANAPAWGPQSDAPNTGFEYLTNGDSQTAANRFLPNVRTVATQVTDYHDDGSAYTIDLQENQSLIPRRFSLARLDWLGRSGPQNGGTTENIQATFGLRWMSGARRWEYVGHTGTAVQTTIKTLQQVATENRLPNYFELLASGILNGSLGLVSQHDPAIASSVANDHTAVARRDATYGVAANQIFQIGANIMDQWDADSFPTRIAFGPPAAPEEFVGSENIPHLYRLQFGAYRPDETVAGEARAIFNAWLEPELWNPYVGPLNDPPTRYRMIQTNGQLEMQTSWLKADGDVKTPCSPAALTGRFIEIQSQNLSTMTSDPMLLDSLRKQGASVTGSRPEDVFDEGSSGSSYTGIWLGKVFAVPASEFKHSNPLPTGSRSNYPSYDFQYHDGSDWVTLQRWMWLLAARGSAYFYKDNNAYTVANFRTGGPLAPLDPRTLRFGVQRMNGDPQYNATPYWNPSDPTTQRGMHQLPLNTGTKFQTPPFDPGVARTDFVLADGAKTYRWADNSSSNGSLDSGAGSGRYPQPRYFDPDGVQRPGDGRWVNATTGAFPLAQGRPQDRPVLLNRPFHSVAEIGYAYRDIPFRSIDFASPQSADAALLDLFSLTEQPPIRAGIVDLNTAPAQVLEAVLRGTVKREGNSTLSQTETTSLVDAVVQARPYATRADLVKVPASTQVIATSYVKGQREAAVRALADVGAARTWNLMADIVAQSGKFPQVGGTAEKDFTVESEARLWEHLAIDRYLGRVIDIQVEKVLE